MQIFSKVYSKLKSKYSFRIFGFNISILTHINRLFGPIRHIKNNGLLFSISKNVFVSSSFRPVYARDIVSQPVNHDVESSVAIVLQGPIVRKENFTFETIKIYQKIHPNALIILSTWDDEPEKDIDQFQALGIKVILSTMPHKPELYSVPHSTKGSNVNLQMLGVSRAIDLASELGITFIAKTRTDARIYSRNFILQSIDLLEQYATSNDHGPIISSDYTSKHLVYSLNDFFHFGHINDMKIYWEYEDYSTKLKSFFNNQIIINKTPVVAEIFLTARYLSKMGLDLNWTLESWWNALKDFFIIVDSQSIDMYIEKNHDGFEQKGSQGGYCAPYSRSVSHAEWRLLKRGFIKGWLKNNGQDMQEKWHEVNGILKKIR